MDMNVSHNVEVTSIKKHLHVAKTSRMVLEQLPPREIAPSPNSNANPKPNPNPNRGATFLGDNCPEIRFLPN